MSTPDLTCSLADGYLMHALTLSANISHETASAGYGRFKPSNRGHNLCCRYYRGGCHRSCPALIRQACYTWQKAYKVSHSDSPHHAYAHCGVCAPAARRSARALVSVPFSGLILPYPLRVIGMVGRYPAICLIRRSPIAWRKRCNSRPFRQRLLPGALAHGELTSVSRGYAPPCVRLTTRY